MRTAHPAPDRPPTPLAPHLLATFNSGFESKDTPDGFLLQGWSARPLVNGPADDYLTPDQRNFLHLTAPTFATA